MKNQKIALFFHITFIALLVAGVVNPGCVAAYIAGAYIWLMMAITWVIMLAGSFCYLGGEAFVKIVHGKIRPFFIRDKPVSPFRLWGVRVLIAVSFSLSGFYSTLVVYIMTMAMHECCRLTFDRQRPA